MIPKYPAAQSVRIWAVGDPWMMTQNEDRIESRLGQTLYTCIQNSEIKTSII